MKTNQRPYPANGIWALLVLSIKQIQTILRFVMEDNQILTCCEDNKKVRLIKFRNLKRTGKGFYLTYTPNNYGNAKSFMVSFCPFCGKDLKRLTILM